jgi:hypothetical protein
MCANVDAVFTNFQEQKNQLLDEHDKLKRKPLKHDKKDKASKKKRVLQLWLKPVVSKTSVATTHHLLAFSFSASAGLDLS